MQVIHDVDVLRKQIHAWRTAGQRISFVPTMGNLHAGHLSLVRAANGISDRVVVSIFVNPLQFGEGEDFDGYPRTLEQDAAWLKELDIPLLLFAPSVSEMYPDGPDLDTRVTVSSMSGILCGRDRPGHFTGVATVVAKLFNLVQPDVAVFGRKDYQQLQVIQRMARDLSLPVEIVGVVTMREADGLAMSSRNYYLDAEQRTRAPALYQALCRVQQQLLAGNHDMAALEVQAREQLSAAGLRPDYVEIRRQYDLQPASPEDQQLVVLAAARLGRARLIDNIELRLN